MHDISLISVSSAYTLQGVSGDVDAGLSEYTLLCHYNCVSDTVPVIGLRTSTHPHAVRCVMTAAIGQAY